MRQLILTAAIVLAACNDKQCPPQPDPIPAPVAKHSASLPTSGLKVGSKCSAYGRMLLVTAMVKTTYTRDGVPEPEKDDRTVWTIRCFGPGDDCHGAYVQIKSKDGAEVIDDTSLFEVQAKRVSSAGSVTVLQLASDATFTVDMARGTVAYSSSYKDVVKGGQMEGRGEGTCDRH